jgi:valyl-tRNA synthetase
LEIKASGAKIAKAIFVPIKNLEIYLEAEIDEKKEAGRIAKEKANLEKVIAALEAKLANSEFVAKAPENIVKTEQEKLANYKIELKKLADL